MIWACASGRWPPILVMHTHICFADIVSFLRRGVVMVGLESVQCTDHYFVPGNPNSWCHEERGLAEPDRDHFDAEL